MRNILFTSGKWICICLLLSMASKQLEAQVYISGPECIVPGITYQYNLHYNGKDSSSTKVCITGGALIGGIRCTPDSVIPTSVYVIWNDTSGQRIELQTMSGNSSLVVQTMEALSGGLLTDSSKLQAYDSTVTGYSFSCSAASGGACAPNYSYQWQSSEDGFKWTDLANGNTKDLFFSGKPEKDNYFRRVTVETQSNTISYSDVGVLTVLHN
ncbi:MAG: hypothetical protein QM802_11580 [Agriterribacter sp.]